LSTQHKRAVQQRSTANGDDNGDSARNGVIIRSTFEDTIYDVVFTPQDEHSFSCPTVTQGGVDAESDIEVGYAAIENFFAHFQSGIMIRVEEALTK